MNDSLELASFLGPLHGVALRRRTDPLATPQPGEALVAERPLAALPPGTRSQRFIVLPGTGGGYVLLDARNSAVFRAGVALLPRGRLATRCMSGMLHAISHVGLARRAAPRTIEIVERDDQTIPSLHERFVGLPSDLCFNVASGVPGRDQKTIVQLVTRDGAVIAYAKIARSDAARALVRHESQTLRSLAELGIEAPHLFGVESTTTHDVLVQSAITGRRSPPRLDARHLRYLQHIEQRTTRELPLAESVSHRRTLERLSDLATRADATWLEIFRALAQRLAGCRMHCGLAHGDFTPWNVLVERESAWAFDWEHARSDAPRGFDATHFALQQAVLVEHVAPERLYAHVIERACVASTASRDVELAAYLLDVAVSDEARELEQRSPFVQARWLRVARMQLARAVLERWNAREARAA